MIGLIKATAAAFVAQGEGLQRDLPWQSRFALTQPRRHDTGEHAQTRAGFTARQSMGRRERPEEIATLALYFAPGSELALPLFCL